MHHTRLQARSLAAGAAELVLHVDDSNGPARRLYEELGFVPGRLAAPLVEHFMGDRFMVGTSAPQLLLSKVLPLDSEATRDGEPDAAAAAPAAGAAAVAPAVGRAQQLETAADHHQCRLIDRNPGQQQFPALQHPGDHSHPIAQNHPAIRQHVFHLSPRLRSPRGVATGLPVHARRAMLRPRRDSLPGPMLSGQSSPAGTGFARLACSWRSPHRRAAPRLPPQAS